MDHDEAQAVDGLMDALLPGGGQFPSAGQTGMGALLLGRLAAADATLPARIAAAVQAAGGLSPGQQAAECAARIEAAEPKLFAEIRKYAYLTYYEQPAVIDAIRALGFSYNDSPLPDGYAPDPFEAPRDAPRHGRGHWIRTEDVQPVDVAALRLEESAP